MAEQIPIPDQLMRIRQQLAALKAEEEALRNILLSDPSTRIGSDYIAAVKEVVSYRVRGKELEQENPELFAKLAKETVSKQVWLVRRAET